MNEACMACPCPSILFRQFQTIKAYYHDGLNAGRLYGWPDLLDKIKRKGNKILSFVLSHNLIPNLRFTMQCQSSCPPPPTTPTSSRCYLSISRLYPSLRPGRQVNAQGVFVPMQLWTIRLHGLSFIQTSNLPAIATDLCHTGSVSAEEVISLLLTSRLKMQANKGDIGEGEMPLFWQGLHLSTESTFYEVEHVASECQSLKTQGSQSETCLNCSQQAQPWFQHE